jgi:hypothetical protein
MNMYSLAVTVFLAFGCAFAQARQPVPPVPIPPAPPMPKKEAPLLPALKPAEVVPGLVEVRFADGSLVKTKLQHDTLNVITKYGTLKVPVSDLKSIEFGFRYAPGEEQRITDAITRLGDARFVTREMAMSDLQTYKERAYPLLKKALKHTDREIVKRTTELIEKLEAKVPADKLQFRLQDTVKTTDFAAVGKVDLPNFKVQTPYFGTAELQLADLVTMRTVGLAQSIETTIDASKFGLSNNAVWMDTGIDADKEMPLTIQASGQIDLWPQGGNYRSGPDGNFRNTGNGPGLQAPGALIGRIGTNGSPFLVGSKYQGKPPTNGRLFLRINGSPWNNESVGAYTLKITLGDD